MKLYILLVLQTFTLAYSYRGELGAEIHPLRAARDGLFPPLPPLPPRLPPPPFALPGQRVPVSGPCILNGEDSYKCTEKGYYEMVQCDNHGCFCVDTNSGGAAHGTRTASNKTAPRCSACHRYLSNLFSRGEVSDGTYIPRCDNGLGDFKEVQCDARSEFCFCVDVKTGKEINGTKKRKQNNEIFSCGKKHEVPQSLPTKEIPVGRETCRLDSDKGHRCSNATTRVMYHFDVKTFSCLAFEHLGCGGNQNKYYTKSDCQSDCILMDFNMCAGMSQPARDRKGDAINCNSPMLPTGPESSQSDNSCPSGYTCRIGGFVGFCCDTKNEERYSKAYRPKCRRGKPLSDSSKGYEDILFGKTCSNNFCPRTHHCEQGDIFAHCCPA